MRFFTTISNLFTSPTILPEKTASRNLHQWPTSLLSQIIGIQDIETLWISRLYPNPHPCQSSSCLIHKRGTFTAISLRLDRKTRFSRRSFNGGANTALMHPSVLITLASRNKQSKLQASLPIKSHSENSTILILHASGESGERPAVICLSFPIFPGFSPLIFPKPIRATQPSSTIPTEKRT